MQLYIANATRQVQDFHYRLPEIAQVRQQKIAIGGQIRISGDLTTKDIEAIIQQHVKYGMIAVTEIEGSRAFAPLCFQVDKPISPHLIEMLANRNTGVLQDRGREQRKNAAIVMANNLGANMRENGTGDEFESLEVETIEDDTQLARNRRASTGEERHQEKTIVTREDREPATGRGRGGRGRGGRGRSVKN